MQKRKIFHRAQVQRLHTQNHRRQRGAQNFGVGKGGALGKVGLVIQADANAIGHAPAAPCALIRRCLANWLYQQLFHLLAVAVALDPRRARIHHITNAGHGERGLGHIGRQHNAALPLGVKNAVLLALCQPCVQGQDLGAAQHGAVAEVAAQMFSRVADFALARQKHQNIAAFAARPKFIHRIGYGLVQAVIAAVLKGAVALLNRKHAPRDHKHRRGLAAFRVFKVLGKALGIDGGRGDDDFEIGALGQNLAQIAQQKIDVQAALVRLVNDEGVVGFQQRVGLRLCQQNPVRHQLNRCAGADAVVKTHFVAYQLAQRGLQFLSNAAGDAGSGNTARLRVANKLAPPASLLGLRGAT